MNTTDIFNIIDFIYYYFVFITDHMSSLLDLCSKFLVPHILIGALLYIQQVFINGIIVQLLTLCPH